MNRWLQVATSLSLAAALIHLWVVPEHAEVWWGYGAFFGTVSFSQALFCLLLPRLGGRKWFLLAGIFGTILLLGLWVQSRVWHAPLGPHRLHAEPVTALDGITAVIELAIISMLATGYRLASARRPGPEPTGPTPSGRKRDHVGLSPNP